MSSALSRACMQSFWTGPLPGHNSCRPCSGRAALGATRASSPRMRSQRLRAPGALLDKMTAAVPSNPKLGEVTHPPPGQLPSLPLPLFASFWLREMQKRGRPSLFPRKLRAVHPDRRTRTERNERLLVAWDRSEIGCPWDRDSQKVWEVCVV